MLWRAEYDDRNHEECNEHGGDDSYGGMIDRVKDTYDEFVINSDDIGRGSCHHRIDSVAV